MFGKVLLASLALEAGLASAYPHIAEAVAAQNLEKGMFFHI